MSMITTELAKLAKWAVALRGWKRLSGMTLTDGERTVVVTHSEYSYEEYRGECYGLPCSETMIEPAYGLVVKGRGATETIPLLDEEWLPDLTDAATLGCLLAIVREAWGDPEAYTRTQLRGASTVWTVYIKTRIKTRYAQIQRGPAMTEDGDMLYGPTEAHALVAALEGAINGGGIR